MGKEDGGEIESESTFMPCGVLLFPFCYQFTIYNQLAIINVFQLDGGEKVDGRFHPTDRTIRAACSACAGVGLFGRKANNGHDHYHENDDVSCSTCFSPV